MYSFSCDLLSISVLSIFVTNEPKEQEEVFKVVICFQFQFFLSLLPTAYDKLISVLLLWFAFNFSSFYLCYQQGPWKEDYRFGCDLLSISVLSIFVTNNILNGNINVLVVICFQFQFFLSLLPTHKDCDYLVVTLWFAFNFSSFYLCYQPMAFSVSTILGCDLLSISVLSIFVTNRYPTTMHLLGVVICFQFQFFLSLLPTPLAESLDR